MWTFVTVNLQNLCRSELHITQRQPFALSTARSLNYSSRLLLTEKSRVKLKHLCDVRSLHCSVYAATRDLLKGQLNQPLGNCLHSSQRFFRTTPIQHRVCNCCPLPADFPVTVFFFNNFLITFIKRPPSPPLTLQPTHSPI